MAAAVLANRVRQRTATTGTGTLTLGVAYSNAFLTFAEAGVADGAQVRYEIDEGADFEVGLGTYDETAGTLTRDTVTVSKIGGTAGTAKMSLSGAAVVRITFAAEDYNALARMEQQVVGGGLATGGGDLSADRTITVSAASQAQQEAGASSAVAVTPAVQQFHPSAVKFWVRISQAGGTPTMLGSYNVSSVTGGGTGLGTVNIDVDFSADDNTCIVGGCGQSGVRRYIDFADGSAVKAGSVQYATATSNGLGNASYIGIAGFGDQ